MFRGISYLALDTKARMTIPSRYRDPLHNLCQGNLVATIDVETPCLLLYPMPEWEAIEQQLINLPNFNPTVRRLQRLIIGHAAEVELDASGRILLPDELRRHAGIVKQVALIGQVRRFELWDAETWRQKKEEWLETGMGDSEWPTDLGDLSL